MRNTWKNHGIGILLSFENGNICSCKIERFAWKHDGVDFQGDSLKLFHLKFSRCMNEVRMPKRRPSLGREPVQKVRNHEQSVKRTRLLWKNFANSSASFVHQPASAATSFQSYQCFIPGKLFQFARPVCHDAGWKRLLTRHWYGGGRPGQSVHLHETFEPKFSKRHTIAGWKIPAQKIIHGCSTREGSPFYAYIIFECRVAKADWGVEYV